MNIDKNYVLMYKIRMINSSASKEMPLPVIKAIEGGEELAEIDPFILAATMSELGVSDEAIRQTTVLLDGKNHVTFRGVAFPDSLSWLAKRKFPEHTDDIDGPVIRLSAQFRGRPRSATDMNRTLVHEVEHLAQYDRRDMNVAIGRFAIYGGMILGAIAGNVLARERRIPTRALATIGGAIIGKQIGYQVAPHEHQARCRSDDIATTAVKLSSAN